MAGSGTMSGVTASSPTPRRVQTPSWLDPRLLLGLALVLGSVLVGAKVVTAANHSYRMLAVNRDLAAGTVLSTAELSTVHVRLSSSSRAAYLDSAGKAVGRRLNRALARGELVPAAAVATPAALTTVTIPFGADAAPALAPGQRMRIWLSTKACPSAVLLADVTVQAVHISGGGSFSSAGGQNVVVSVEPELATRVVDALAKDGATIRAGVLSGPRAPAANADLPDLSGCRAPAS
jgi:hypothetical protein